MQAAGALRPGGLLHFAARTAFRRIAAELQSFTVRDS
jgi:hypothetical protein